MKRSFPIHWLFRPNAGDVKIMPLMSYSVKYERTLAPTIEHHGERKLYVYWERIFTEYF